MKKTILLCVSVLLAFPLCYAAYGGDFEEGGILPLPRGTAYIQVKDQSTHNPLPGASVRLVNTNGTEYRSGVTNADGRFSFGLFGPRQLGYQISKSGYSSASGVRTFSPGSMAVFELAPGAVCGDGICAGEPFETPSSCSEDCGTCGNLICEPPEDRNTCVIDCASCVQYPPDDPRHFDGICDIPENKVNCPNDCCSLACGDGICDDVVCGESGASCPADCNSRVRIQAYYSVYLPGYTHTFGPFTTYALRNGPCGPSPTGDTLACWRGYDNANVVIATCADWSAKWPGMPCTSDSNLARYFVLFSSDYGNGEFQLKTTSPRAIQPDELSQPGIITDAAPTCGDGICSRGESPDTCPVDCTVPARKGAEVGE